MKRFTFSLLAVFFIMQLSAQPIYKSSSNKRYFLDNKFEFLENAYGAKYLLEVKKDSSGILFWKNVYNAPEDKKAEGNLLFLAKMDHPLFDGEWIFYDRKGRIKKKRVFRNLYPVEKIIISTMDLPGQQYKVIGLVAKKKSARIRPIRIIRVSIKSFEEQSAHYLAHKAHTQ